MAIRTVITRGYGNGTFNGTIALIIKSGYISSAVTVAILIAVSPTTAVPVLSNNSVVPVASKNIAEV